MALFKRRRGAADEAAEAAEAPEAPEVEAADAEPAGAAAPDQAGAAEDAVRPSGPFDVSERPETEGLLDFGAIRLPIDRSAKVTVEVARETGQPVSVVVAKDGSRLQLTAFAAPKRGGLWDAVIREQQSALVREGATVTDATGPFGPELVAQVPTTTAQGRQGKQVLRFIGADGPRWLLRGALGGKAARDPAAAADLEDLFARTVVVRGSEAMPPREALPLRLPTGARPAQDAAPAEDPTSLLKRGPEITEVR
jgi:hypothetical protein